MSKCRWRNRFYWSLIVSNDSALFKIVVVHDLKLQDEWKLDENKLIYDNKN